MTHTVKPHQRKRAPEAQPAPAPTVLDGSPLRERPGLPDGPAGPTRMNIESVDENQAESMQSPAAEPEPGVPGFIESTDDEDGDAHLPPGLEPT